MSEMTTPRGLFIALPDDLNYDFHEEIERRLGRPIQRGDVTKAGIEAIKLWLSS